MSGVLTVVESEAFHITDLHVDYSPVEAVERAPIAPARALPKQTARLGLQQHAQSNFRRYFLRALWRFAGSERPSYGVEFISAILACAGLAVRR